MRTSPTLYGVSLGPGDPGLITRRAWELLHTDAFWTYPVRKAKSDSYALSIVQAAGLVLPEQHQALVFPMTHNKEILVRYWLNAAEYVVQKLHQGKDVVFLVEGDASTYSTFSHLARTVKTLDASVNVETVAGVSSFNAAAARLNETLADVDDSVAIVPAGYGIEKLDTLLGEVDTLILLKVKPLLDDIIDWLSERELLGSSYFVEKAGSPDEKVVRELALLRNQKINYLSLILIKNPNRVKGEIIRGCRKKSAGVELVVS